MKNLSHVGRKIFENKRTNTALGEILALAAVFVGLIGHPVSASDHPKKDLEALAFKENTAIGTQVLKLKFPLEGGFISQGFRTNHPAIDITASVGTPIYPVTKGVVEQVGFNFQGLGRIVVVNHGSGFKSLYAHLKNAEVEVGQEVNETTVIGRVGLTGRTSGPHLHLEFHEDGRYFNPADFLSLGSI